MLSILDEVLAMLEPDAQLRDGTCARPVVYTHDLLYGWPRRSKYDPEGDGSLDEHQFTVRLAWAADANFEVESGVRDRATTLAIDAKVSAMRAAIAANRTGATYEHLQVDAVDYETLITSHVRGVYVDVSGYMLL